MLHAEHLVQEWLVELDLTNFRIGKGVENTSSSRLRDDDLTEGVRVEEVGPIWVQSAVVSFGAVHNGSFSLTPLLNVIT